MIEVRKIKGYWTKEKCIEKVILCDSRHDFKNRYSSAYNVALQNKWLDEICSHMIEVRKIKGYWTYEKCKEEALKYNNKKEFRKKNGGAYASARKNNWLYDICLHMKLQGNLYNRCIYSYEFSDNCVYVGLTCNIERRSYERLLFKNDTVTKHINKTGLEPVRKQLTEYIDKDEASKLEGIYKQQYIDNGWIILNKAKTGGLGGNIIKWNKDKCKEEALKYTTRTIFQQNNTSAYRSALKNGWLYEICLHMIITSKPNGYWTKERCQEEALKYKTKKEFQKKSNGAYTAIHRYYNINEICLHMIKNKKGVK
jgi:hypothetical protein